MRGSSESASRFGAGRLVLGDPGPCAWELAPPSVDLPLAELQVHAVGRHVQFLQGERGLLRRLIDGLHGDALHGKPD